MTDEQLSKALWEAQTEVFALSESGENEDEDKGLSSSTAPSLTEWRLNNFTFPQT